MSEPKLRGYLLERATKFIEHHYSTERAEKIKASLPDSTRELLPIVNSAQWYPREHAIALNTAIAEAEDSPDASFEALAACGEFMAIEATNTYLRLVMRLLTPSLFCKKVSQFWKRDNSDGDFVVESIDDSAKRIQMRLHGVEGFSHIGPLSLGFLRFGMKTIGTQAQFSQSGWSMTTPAPAEVKYEISWS